MNAPSASTAATAGRTRERRASPPKAVWASLAITAMWAAVVLTALFGGDFTSGATTIPAAVFVAFFACVGSFFTARYGLREDEPDDRR